MPTVCWSKNTTQLRSDPESTVYVFHIDAFITNNKSKNSFKLLTNFLIIPRSLNNSKHFELILGQIGSLEPELLILQDLIKI